MIAWEDGNEPPIRVELNGRVAVEAGAVDGPNNLARIAFAVMLTDMQGHVENSDDNARLFSVGFMSALMMAGAVMHQNGAKVDARAFEILNDLSNMGFAFNDPIESDAHVQAFSKLGNSLRRYHRNHDITEIMNPDIDTRPPEMVEAHRIEEERKAAHQKGADAAGD